MIVAMKDENQHVISGLLKKRESLLRQSAHLREQMAVIAGDIEALDRTLDAFGLPRRTGGQDGAWRPDHSLLSERVAAIPHPALHRSTLRPTTTSELALRPLHGEVEAEAGLAHGRLLADVTKRASKALREMRRLKIVELGIVDRNFVWSIPSAVLSGAI